MRPLLPLLLLSCADAPSTQLPDTAVPADTEPDSESETQPVDDRPELPRIADAIDEDPALQVLEVTLTPAPHPLSIAGAEVQGFAYNEQVPGPTLRAEVGDTLVVHLDNQLETPTTIHWHGAGAPYEMDGVPWRREPTAPGSRFTYTFVLEKAGTFWYHPHFDTARQVDLGLYGLLVVTDPAEPVTDELLVVLDAWAEHDTDPHEHAMEGTEITWTANGAVDPIVTVPAGSATRVRILNASNTGYAAIAHEGLVQLATDQGIQSAPRTPERAVLAPGDRAELLWQTGQTPFEVVREPWTLHGGQAFGSSERLWTVTPEGAGDTPAALPWTTERPLPTPDPGVTDITWTLQGSGETGDWRINFEAFPDVTIEEVVIGDIVIVEVRNLSPSNHPFHMHGHPFEVLSLDGVPPEVRRIEDTIDVPVYGVLRLRFEAIRPGEWMTHCHILPHAEGGMMTVLRVVEPD